MSKKYYGVFDAEGVPRGFYVDDIYPPEEDGTRNSAIVEEAVEISEEAWQELLEGQPFTRYVDGAVARIEPPPPPPPDENSLEKLTTRINKIEQQLKEK